MKSNLAILSSDQKSIDFIKKNKLSSTLNLYANSSRNIEVAQIFAETHNFKKYYGAYEDLIRDKGVESIAIPHNSNGSNGQMFEVEQFDGSPIDKEYSALRMRNEPIVEMTQVKGTSDTHPLLSPNDEWADFGIMNSRVGSFPRTYSLPSGGYVRDAFFRGMVLEWEDRGNPYKFGLIGSSDIKKS